MVMTLVLIPEPQQADRERSDDCYNSPHGVYSMPRGRFPGPKYRSVDPGGSCGALKFGSVRGDSQGSQGGAASRTQGPRVPKHEFADRHPLRETVPRSTIIPDDREAVRVDRERPDGTIRCGLRQQQRRAAER